MGNLGEVHISFYFKPWTKFICTPEKSLQILQAGDYHELMEEAKDRVEVEHSRFR